MIYVVITLSFQLLAVIKFPVSSIQDIVQAWIDRIFIRTAEEKKIYDHNDG